MRSSKFLLTAFVLLLHVCAFSQSKIFENVIDVELKSSVAITSNKQIVGYAFFYKIDKMKKAGLYRLAILDENLKEIGSNEFEGGKDLILKRAMYESEKLLLSFYDDDKYDQFKQFVKVFDLKGKQLGMVGYDPEKVKKGMFGASAAEQMEALYEGMENVEGKGFVRLYQSKAKTGGVDIQFIDLSGKLKWEKNISADKGDRTDLYLITTTPNTVLLCQMDRSGIMSAEAKVFLVGLATDNGKELFKKPLDIKGYSYEPMLVKKTDDGKLKMVSSLLNEDAKFLKALPRGISIADLNDQTGEIKIIKDFTFEGELSNVMTMKSGSKTEDGYIKPHNLIMMNDGSMVLVGEFFRKTVSAGGMAMKVLSQGGTSAAQATLDDLFLLRINDKLKATALEKVEKDKQRFLLPSDFMSIGMTAKWLTYLGAYGYMYTDEGMDGTQKTVLARGSFGDEKYGTVAITIDEKKGFTQKRFSVEKEKNVSYHIQRAKPGYVMISKYNSKKKSLSVSLEKTN